MLRMPKTVRRMGRSSTPHGGMTTSRRHLKGSRSPPQVAERFDVSMVPLAGVGAEVAHKDLACGRVRPSCTLRPIHGIVIPAT